jgi:hypothetical protein
MTKQPLHHKLLKVKEDGFYWLIDSEVEDAIIEIKKNISYGMKVFFMEIGNMVYFKNGGNMGEWNLGGWHF